MGLEVTGAGGGFKMFLHSYGLSLEGALMACAFSQSSKISLLCWGRLRSFFSKFWRLSLKSSMDDWYFLLGNGPKKIVVPSRASHGRGRRVVRTQG